MISGEMAAAVQEQAQAPVERKDTYVVVDGARYRVTRKGDEFVVNKKATVVRYSIAERDAQRKAVIAATGCKPIDELPGSARLKGKLDCQSDE